MICLFTFSFSESRNCKYRTEVANQAYNCNLRQKDGECIRLLASLQSAALGDEVEEKEEEEDGGRAAPVGRGRDPAEAMMPRHLK